jgi:hypothetical protein
MFYQLRAPKLPLGGLGVPSMRTSLEGPMAGFILSLTPQPRGCRSCKHDLQPRSADLNLDLRWRGD